MAETIAETKTHRVVLNDNMSLVIYRIRSEASDDLELLPEVQEEFSMFFDKQELTNVLYKLVASDKTDPMQRTALRYMLTKVGFLDPDR